VNINFISAWGGFLHHRGEGFMPAVLPLTVRMN